MAGRARAPLSAMVNNTTSDSDGTDLNNIEFTKEDIESLLNEKMKKGNPYNNKVSLILLNLSNLSLILKNNRCYVRFIFLINQLWIDIINYLELLIKIMVSYYSTLIVCWTLFLNEP